MLCHLGGKKETRCGNDFWSICVRREEINSVILCSASTGTLAFIRAGIRILVLRVRLLKLDNKVLIGGPDLCME